MSTNSLRLINLDLALLFQQALPSRLHAVTLAACRLALGNTNLTDPVVLEALKALESGIPGDPALRVALESLVSELDEIQWNLQKQFEQGQVEQVEYEAAFQRARAANALWCALDPDAFEAASQSVYEAHAAVGEDTAKLMDTILPVLGKHAA